MKRIMALLLALCTVLPVAACGDKTPDEQAKTDTVIVCDFESRDEVRKIDFGNYFGRNSLNSDKTFVRSGEKSLKIQTQGYGLGDGTGGYPYISFATGYLADSDDETDYGDFELVEYVMFDIYNDNADEKKITIALEDKNYQRTSDKEYVLPAKSWSRVVYDTNRANLSLTFDMAHVRTVIVSFEPTRFDEELPTYYIDRYAYKYAAEKAEAQITLDEDEICSFDKEYQAYATVSSIMGGGGSRVCVPATSINTSPKFAKSGSSLRVDMAHGSVQDASWPYFVLSEKLLKSIDFTKYGMDDEIVFDLYNGNNFSYRITTYVGIKTDSIGLSGAIAINEWTIKPGNWTECRIKLSAIAGKQKIGEDEDKNPIYANDTSVLKDFNSFLFVWGEFPSADRVMYIDSMRVERAK